MPTALTTLSDLKLALSAGGAPTPSDGALNMLITQVSALIEEYLGRTIGQASYTQVLLGNNTAYLRLRNRPVQVTGLTVYLDEQAWWGQAPGAFATGTLLVQGTDYVLVQDMPDGSSRSGLLAKVNAYWPKPNVRQMGLLSPTFGEMGNVKATYTGGFATVPPDLAMACNIAIANVIRISGLGAPVLSESLGAYSYTVQSLRRLDVLEPVYSILRRYKDFVIG